MKDNGYIEVFGTDQDGGERSFQVYYSIILDGKMLKGIDIEYEGDEHERGIYYDEQDIWYQVQNAITQNEDYRY